MTMVVSKPSKKVLSRLVKLEIYRDIKWIRRWKDIG